MNGYQGSVTCDNIEVTPTDYFLGPKLSRLAYIHADDSHKIKVNFFMCFPYVLAKTVCETKIHERTSRYDGLGTPPWKTLGTMSLPNLRSSSNYGQRRRPPPSQSSGPLDGKFPPWWGQG